ncbi:SDR family oxidoreductase [Pseudomonadales bacterium]|nr:SDR family oxidoreductase [Pseudomonadales bacterium]
MIDYNNKVVLVTGAASGIGAALARALTARGARVVCADINADGLQQTVVATGNKAKAITCDLADPNVAEQLIDDVYTEMGRLDLVCSNAGIGFAGKLAKTDFSDPRIDKLFEINLLPDSSWAAPTVRVWRQPVRAGVLSSPHPKIP